MHSLKSLSLTFILISSFATTLSFANDIDNKFKSAVNTSLNGQLDTSRELFDQITKEQDNFFLGHWLRSSIYATLSGQPLPKIKMQGKLKEELQTRFKLWQDDDKIAVPDEVYFISEKVPFLIAVDSKINRLVLYKNTTNGLQIMHDYYTSIGRNGAGKQKEGDLRTPIGVYFINSFITDDRLARRYGTGAFPLNYPNIWDKYNNRTGSGIWLHGTDPNTYSRPPLDSGGCITLSNNQILDLRKITSNINSPLPILVGHPIRWTNKATKQNLKDKVHFEQHWERWKKAMDKSDWPILSQFYSRDKFNMQTKHFDQWRTKQVRLNQTGFYKSKVEPRLIIAYSNNSAIIVDYARTTQQGEKKIRQYWKKTPEGWLIIYENIVRT